MNKKNKKKPKKDIIEPANVDTSPFELNLQILWRISISGPDTSIRTGYLETIRITMYFSLI